MHLPIYCFPPDSIDVHSSRHINKRVRVTVRRGAALVTGLLILAGTMAWPDAYRNAQKAQDEQGIAQEPGKPIKREISGGATHSYQLTLPAGQYAWVAVDQFRINVALSGYDPDGKKLFEIDLFVPGDPERVLLVAETAGTYRLNVVVPDQTAPKSHYEIKIKELRSAAEPDKSLVAAERLILEGILLKRQLTADSWRKAIEKYQQSIPFSKSAVEPAWEATALYLISNVYINLGEKQKALDSYIKYHAIYKGMGRLQSRIIELNNIGFVYATLGDPSW